jgi:creatinine amidohydrolase
LLVRCTCARLGRAVGFRSNRFANPEEDSVIEESSTVGEVRWQKLRREQIAGYALLGAVLLLPIGAVEQHGPHLPVDTDVNAADAVALRAAGILGPAAALVLPPIPWGVSPYWLPFAGTISLRAETILGLIADIGSSVAAHGFRRVVIVNGHGGNAGIIALAATQLAAYGIRTVSLSYWSLIAEELKLLAPADHGHIGHAGQTETSIQLHLQPERVDPAYTGISDMTDLADTPNDLVAPGIYRPPLPELEAPNGVYGNPTQANATIGSQIIELAADRLAAQVTRLAAEPYAGQ